MLEDYAPARWHWIVAGDLSRVYSGAAQGYIPPTDEAYAAWLADGNRPTRIASEAELRDVLKAYGLVLFAGDPPVVPLEERVAQAEAEAKALRAALVKKGAVSEQEIEAERSAYVRAPAAPV